MRRLGVLAALFACIPGIQPPPPGAAFVRVEIAQPADGATLGPGRVSLRGRALDTRAMPEEPLARMVWSSDRDGELGTGSRIEGALASPGTHLLTLTASTPEGDANTAHVTVTVASIPDVRIAVPAEGAAFLPGAAPGVQIDVRCRAVSRASGAELFGDALRWFVDGGAEPVAAGGSAALTLDAGAHRIVCRGSDPGGANTGEDAVTVTVGAPVVRMLAPRDGETVFAGRPVAFRAEVLDTEATSPDRLDWIDSRGTPLASGNEAQATFNAAGEVRLRAVYRRVGGESAEAALTVFVARADAPPQVSITRPAADPTTLAEGEDLELFASASDAESSALHIAWWDSMAGALGEGPSARISAAAAGKHVVTARVTDAAGQPATDTRVVYTLPAAGAALLESAAPGPVDLVAASGRHLYYARAGEPQLLRLDPDAEADAETIALGGAVRVLAATPSGALAATDAGYAVCAAAACTRFAKTGPGRLPSASATAVLFVPAAADRPARLFVGTDHGLFIAADPAGSSEGRTCLVSTGSSGGPPGSGGATTDVPVTDLAWDEARRAIWVATAAAGVLRGDPAAPSCALEPGAGLGDAAVRAVASRAGEVWFGTAHGLYRLGDPEGRDLRDWGAASTQVNDIAVSPAGILWVAAAGGACRWDPATRAGACLVAPSELPAGEVRAVALRGEEKWFATPAGLHRWLGR